MLGENGLHFPGDLGDDLLQLLLGPAHVVPLVGEVSIALVDPVELLDGVQVDVAQAGDAPLELSHPLLGLGHALQLLPLGPGRLVGELVGLPELVQDLLLLHGGGHLFLLQHRDLPLHVQQLAILVPALLVGPVPLCLQGQALLVELLDLGLPSLVLHPDGLELLLLGPDLFIEVVILGLQLTEHIFPLLLVAGDVPAQVLQLGKGLLGGGPLGLQGGGLLAELGDPGAHRLHPGPDLRLARGLALGLQPQGGGGALQRLDPGSGVGGIRLGLAGAALDLGELRPQAPPLALQVGAGLLLGGAPLLQLKDPVLQLTALGLGGLQLVDGHGRLPPGLLQSLDRLVQLGPHPVHLGVQPLQLVGPAEDARRAGGRAARHGAARVEDLAVQGNDLEAVAVFPGHGDGGVHVLGHHHPAQQIGKDVFVSGVELHQPVPHAHEAGLVLHGGIPELGGADGAQGEEGTPTAVPALQEGDGSLAVLLAVHHDVLHGAPQGNLHRHRVGVGHVDQSGHRAVDVAEVPPLGLPHDQLHRLGVALVELLHLGEHMDPGGEGVLVHLELPVGLLGGLHLPLPGLGTHDIAADDVAQGLPVLFGLFEVGRDLPGHRMSGGELLLPGGELLPDGLVPVQQLLGGGGQGGEEGLGLSGGGVLHGLLLPQGLQLALQGTGAAALVLVGLPGGGELLLQPGSPGGDLLQAGAALVDLLRDGPGPALLLVQLPFDPVGVFQVALDLGPEHRHRPLALVGVGLALLDLEPDALGLHVLLPHFGGVVLGGGVEPLHQDLGLLLLADGVFIVGEKFSAVRADLVQLVHPQRDLQPPELVPQDQEFFGLLRLGPERLHLELQLVDLVVDPDQVLLGALQLPLRLLLPVAVAGDAGGLLKDLPAVGALDGQDLVDLALADNGVALPAQAGVHEELVHIPETHGVAVDEVLALPRAVVPPGDHDLALLPVEEVTGVVQHQGDLGKPQLLALGGAAEDDVLHLAAPESTGGLFPHDPADGVGDIGFAAAVGSHDGGDVVVEGQDRLVRKGFEALDLQFFKIHKYPSFFS